MTEAPEELTNQTLFSNQEPLLQSGDRSSSFLSQTEKTPEELAAAQKNKKIMTVGLVAGGILIVLIVLLAVLSPKRTTIQVTASPTPTPVSHVNRTEFQARLDELSDDLTNADPTKQSLTAPPVDLTLTLDPLPRQ